MQTEHMSYRPRSGCHHRTPLPSALHNFLWHSSADSLEKGRTSAQEVYALYHQREEEAGKGRGLLSDVKLVSSQVVHEGLHQEVCGEVKDQTEGDGDGQCRQSLLKNGQQQQSEAQALRQEGNK